MKVGHADYNLTCLNSTMIDIYLVPNLDWHLNNEKFDLTKLNLTWNITEYGNFTDFM